MKYKTWTLIDWDGNPKLGLKCWRKSFRKGHVSIGVGEFMAIVFSYGPNSDKSYSSTRWRGNGKHLSERDAMKAVDAAGGSHVDC